MLPESLQQAPTVFDGVRFHVRRVALPSHTPGAPPIRREVCVTADAVVVLPMLDPGTVVLIRNERFAVGQTLWELPAGTVEPGEAPAACAGRELIEETGYRAGRLSHLVDFYPTPGFCTERMHAFLARDLGQAAQKLDENERITVEIVPLERAMAMVRDNTIHDAKTIATLLYYHQFERKGA